MEFDVAISLGINCQCRFNISRTLYKREYGCEEGFFISEHGKNVNDYGSFFFDWSVSPIHSVINILKNKFEGCLELSQLKLVDLPSGEQTVIDTGSLCEYPHAFAKTANANCTFQDIKEAYNTFKEKYDYIKTKTLNVLTSNKKILFVLTGNYYYKDVVELCEVLSSYTNNYKLLYTPWENKPGFEEHNHLYLDSRLIITPIRHAPYPGDFESWDVAFKDIYLKT